MTLKHYAAILMALFMEQTYATNFNSEPYTLPPNKVYLDNCQKEALQLHKGNIVEETLHRLNEHYIVRYAIESDDGKLWSVLCDLENSKIYDEHH
jgi:hypothetical protein